MNLEAKFKENTNELATGFQESTESFPVNVGENAQSFPARFEESDQSFSAQLKEEEILLHPNFGEVQTVTKYIGGEPYDGSYEITPKIEKQTMPTEGKVMVSDVTIHKIPYFEVSNNGGGNTVYIADEI